MDYTVLSDSPLFKGLTAGDIEAILSEVPHRIKKNSTGSIIAQSGDHVKSLLVVLKGVVKGEMVDYSGRVIKIEDIQAPGAIASAFMFGKKNTFPVNVVAESDTEILVLEKSELLNILKHNERILVNFLDMISTRSQFLSEKIKFLTFKTIKGKLAQYILQKAGEDRVSITLDRTQNDLADFFGVARPSIARALGEMEDDGYIIAERKNIKILDRKGLGELTLDY